MARPAPPRDRPAPKAVYFDLDGTLLGPESRIQPVVVKTLEALQGLGVAVGLATGRLFESTRPYAEQVRCNAPLILLNGARVTGPAGSPCHYQAHLSREAAAAVVAEARRHSVHVNLYWEDRYFMEDLDHYGQAFVSKEHFMPLLVDRLEDRLDRDPVKLLLIGDPERLEGLRQEALPQVGDEVQFVFSEPDFLEVLPPGVSKGHALVRAAGLLGLPVEEMAAFGDGPNDAHMLAVAGFGVAVANARPAARRAADRVATRPYWRGVLEGLAELFPGLAGRLPEGIQEAAE